MMAVAVVGLLVNLLVLWMERGLMDTVPGLAAVSHVHVWQLTSGRTMATLHVRPDTDEHDHAHDHSISGYHH